MPAAKIIEIASLPIGRPPEWVRKAWIGCELPCADLECGHIPLLVDGPPSDRTGPMSAAEFLAAPPPVKVDGFNVHMDIALQSLSYHNRSTLAADWFYRNGYPIAGKCFRFRLCEVKVLKYWGHDEGGPIVRYDDMETGTMRQMP